MHHNASNYRLVKPLSAIVAEEEHSQILREFEALRSGYIAHGRAKYVQVQILTTDFLICLKANKARFHLKSELLSKISSGSKATQTVDCEICRFKFRRFTDVNKIVDIVCKQLQQLRSCRGLSKLRIISSNSIERNRTVDFAINFESQRQQRRTGAVTLLNMTSQAVRCAFTHFIFE
jgi:hypothetical protein